MKLQPLTVMFIGLFCCSLGLNILQIKDYLNAIKRNNKTIIIILRNNNDQNSIFPKKEYLLTQE